MPRRGLVNRLANEDVLSDLKLPAGRRASNGKLGRNRFRNQPPTQFAVDLNRIRDPTVDQLKTIGDAVKNVAERIDRLKERDMQ
jgi:hypothetical protein